MGLTFCMPVYFFIFFSMKVAVFIKKCDWSKEIVLIS